MKKVLLFILVVCQTIAGFAAAVSFTAKLSHNTAEVGQRIQITFTLNANGSNFTPPSFENFRILSGPNQSSSMQYVNGNMSQSLSFSYILQTTEKGSFEIGPANIRSGGKTYKTQPLKIKVVEASPHSANAQRNKQQQRKANGKDLNDYVYVKAFVDKRSAYVGEKVTVTYKLFSKLQLSTIDFESFPAFTGFWKQDIELEITPQKLKQERINGEIFNTINVHQTVLYPQRSGSLEISPLEMLVHVNVQSRRSRSIWDQMFGSYERKAVSIKSNAPKIDIKSLPVQGKPANFTGAVGSFKMNMTNSKDTVESNEAIDFKIQISGNGNLPLISAPQLNFPSDFEVYDPETKDLYKTDYNGAQGKKVFSYLAIPRYSGDFKLDPFSFTFFDLKTKKYKTLQADPITIKVTKGEAEENVIYSSSRKEDVALLNTDIRFIHINNLSLLSANDLFYNSPLFFGLLALSLVLAVLTYFFSKKIKEKHADQIGLRKSKANKLAKRRLSKAKNFLDKGDSASFYEEISAAIYGYFSDKFAISIADLSQEKIIDLLINVANTTALQNDVQELLENAEMARFAPSSTIDSKSLYLNAVEIISKTEDLKI